MVSIVPADSRMCYQLRWDLADTNKGFVAHLENFGRQKD